MLILLEAPTQAFYKLLAIAHHCKLFQTILEHGILHKVLFSVIVGVKILVNKA